MHEALSCAASTTERANSRAVVVLAFSLASFGAFLWSHAGGVAAWPAAWRL